MLARHKRGAAYGTICSGGRLEALIQARERLCRRCQPVYRCEARSAAGRWTATRAPPAPRSSPQPTPWTVSGPTTLCSRGPYSRSLAYRLSATTRAYFTGVLIRFQNTYWIASSQTKVSFNFFQLFVIFHLCPRSTLTQLHDISI